MLNRRHALADQRTVPSVDVPSAKVRSRRPSIVTVAWLCFFAALFAVAAESGYRCGVCDLKIERGTVWTLAETNYICDACHTIPRRCIHCRMPVKIGFAATSDGRHICRRHVPHAVLDEREATTVFRNATDELRRLARGEMELVQTQIPVSLFDTDYWSSKEDADNPDALHKVGFSRTSWVNGLTNHSIVMLSGQLRETLASVSAHEYAHLWINENRPKDRDIEPDTIEGICELAAWKLMQARGETGEQTRIESNAYTRGRILELIEIEKQIGFAAVLDWVKRGSGRTLSRAKETVAPGPEPSRNQAALDIWRAASRASRAPVRESLRLDGLVERSDRTVALINGVTVEAGDAAEIRLNGELVKLTVEGITNGSVVLRTNGHPEPVVLKLEAR